MTRDGFRGRGKHVKKKHEARGTRQTHVGPLGSSSGAITVRTSCGVVTSPSPFGVDPPVAGSRDVTGAVPKPRLCSGRGRAVAVYDSPSGTTRQQLHRRQM
jgi:hypothetical protein